jgi:hypothetical protein
VIKVKRIGWTVYIASMGQIRNLYKIVVGDLKGRDYSDTLHINGRIILE